MLSLPPPLRPEHRLAQLVTAAQAIPLSTPHALLHQLNICTANGKAGTSKPTWTLANAHASTVAFSSLAPHLRKQLHTLDEESQRLHWLYEWATTGAMAPRSGFCTQLPTSPITEPRSPLSPNNATACAGAPRVKGPAHCPLLLFRMLLTSRFPDHLLRLLKWLVQSHAELVQQKQDREAENDPTKNKICIAQIERVMAHCSFMEEMAWKLLWKVEHTIKSGVLGTCICTLPESVENLFSPWWNHDCLVKAIRIVSTCERLSEVAIYSFIDAMIGDASLFTMKILTTNANRKHRTLTLSVIKDIDMLPPFLRALSCTSLAVAQQGLEFLSMLLLRLPENAPIILRHGGWQGPLVPLMMSGGGARVEGEMVDVEATEMRVKTIARKTLSDILSREQERRPSVVHTASCTAGTPRGGGMASPPSAAAAGGNSPNPIGSPGGLAAKDTTPEGLLTSNIKLSLNLAVLLHFSHFASASSHESDTSFFQVLCQTSDAIEDQVGWIPQAIQLVRVLLVSLVKKITSSAHKRIFRNDVHHPSWACLFDLLTFCENFLFYSPLSASTAPSAPSAPKVDSNSKQQPTRQQQPHPPPPPPPLPGTPLKDGMRRRTSSIAHLPTPIMIETHERIAPASSPYLARALTTRRFQTVGVHLSLMGACEDVLLVEKVRELLESLKWHELEMHTLNGDAELVDRERVKKLKKRGLAELEFFEATVQYFQSCETQVAVATPSGKSMPELLEKRRHDRKVSGGRLSGMFQNFTRSKRLRSMEQKLNGFVHEVAQRRPSLTDATNAAAGAGRPSFTSVTARPSVAGGPAAGGGQSEHASIGRHFNFSTRHKHARPTFHHGGGGGGSSSSSQAAHAKLSLELVKLKIESHYKQLAAHKRAGSHAHHHLLTVIGMQSAPPIPPNRPKMEELFSPLKEGEAAAATAGATTTTTSKRRGSAEMDELFKQDLMATQRRVSMNRRGSLDSMQRRSSLDTLLEEGEDEPMSPVQAACRRSSLMAYSSAGSFMPSTPLSSLLSLMSRPLPPKPIATAKSPTVSAKKLTASALATAAAATARTRIQIPPAAPADKQVTGRIVLSPTHAREREGFEPKEDEGEGRSGKEQVEGIRMMDGTAVDDVEEDESELDDANCSHCNLQLHSPADTYLNFSQPYCHTCFRAAFCACVACGQLMAEGESYVRVTGVERQPELTSATAGDAAQVEQLFRDAGGNDAEALLYHTGCLACSHCHSRAADCEASPDTPFSPVGAGDATSRSWYAHRGRVYCQRDYLHLFGVACAQCRQVITSGRTVHALGRSWHEGCLVCAGECGRTLQEGEYYLAPPELVSPPMSPARESASAGDAASAVTGAKANKVAYCASCFGAAFQFCHFCSEVLCDPSSSESSSSASSAAPFSSGPSAGDLLSPSEKCIHVRHAGGRKAYHARCYQCVVCLQVNTLDEKLYAGEDEDDRLYCYKHYIWRYFTKCATCGEPIEEGEEGADDEEDAPTAGDSTRRKGGSLTVNDIEYHASCVHCFVCHQDLTRGGGTQVYTRICGRGGPEELQILLCADHRQYNPDPPIKCEACQETIDESETPIKGGANDSSSSSSSSRMYMYHLACLRCSVCRIALGTNSNGQAPICVGDPHARMFCLEHFPDEASATTAHVHVHASAPPSAADHGAGAVEFEAAAGTNSNSKHLQVHARARSKRLQLGSLLS